jgi:hypothetical protein
VVLVIVAVALALLSRSGELALLPEDTPQGTAQRYLLAIEQGESRKAYDYLGSGLQERCTYQRFRETVQQFERLDRGAAEDLRVTLQGTRPVDGMVEVRVRITQFRVSAPFNVSDYSHDQRFTLEKQAGSWRFIDPPWPSWCPEPAKVPPPPPTSMLMPE